MLSEQAKEARRAYRRKWARENQDKVRAQQDRYWMKVAEAAAAESGKAPAQSEPQPEGE